MKYLLSIIFIAQLLMVSAQQSNSMEFRVEGMSCQACANGLAELLKSQEEITEATVDFETKTAKLLTNGEQNREKIRSLIAQRNFEAFFEGETLEEPLSEEAKSKLDIKLIKGGNKIDLNKLAIKNKITILDFYADWCGPCRLYSPKLEKLVFNHPQLALRKIDIVDWKSPLARQLTKEYKMPALPFTLLIDEKGLLLGKIEGNNVEAVEKLIQTNL